MKERLEKTSRETAFREFCDSPAMATPASCAKAGLSAPNIAIIHDIYPLFCWREGRSQGISDKLDWRLRGGARRRGTGTGTKGSLGMVEIYARPLTTATLALLLALGVAGGETMADLGSPGLLW